MFCRVLTDRYRRYFTSVSTDRSPQFSSVRPQYPTEISQNVRYSPSTLQRFYRKFGTLPVPYRDFTDSSVLLQYPTEISQIVRYSPSKYPTEKFCTVPFRGMMTSGSRRRPHLPHSPQQPQKLEHNHRTTPTESLSVQA